MLHKPVRASLALLLATGLAIGQTGMPRTTASARTENSPRLHELMRAGNLYLSLEDALALAIENNLDIELQRYLLPVANSELLRAQGGGTLRGLNFTLSEVPVGTGGPTSSLLTTAAAAAVQPARSEGTPSFLT